MIAAVRYYEFSCDLESDSVDPRGCEKLGNAYRTGRGLPAGSVATAVKYYVSPRRGPFARPAVDHVGDRGQPG